MARVKYTETQKLEALTLLSQNLTGQQVSDITGIPSSTIRTWKAKAPKIIVEATSTVAVNPQLQQPEATGLDLLQLRVTTLEGTIAQLKSYMEHQQQQETKRREQQEYESGAARKSGFIPGRKALN